MCRCSFNARAKRPVECVHCARPACSACLQRHFLSSPKWPTCLFPECRRQWSETALRRLPRTFVRGQWRRHRRALLMRMERAFAPGRSQLVTEYGLMQSLRGRIKGIGKERGQLLSKARELAREAEVCKVRVGVLEKNINHTPLKDEWFAPCPVLGCRGFAVSGACCCCCKRVCAACGDAVEGEHSCNPDAVAARVHTRPCPGCKAPVGRGEGCDQMWCAACHCVFSWSTGAVRDRGEMVHAEGFYRAASEAPSLAEVSNKVASLVRRGRLIEELAHAVTAGYPLLTLLRMKELPALAVGDAELDTRLLGIRWQRGELNDEAYARAVEKVYAGRTFREELRSALLRFVCDGDCVARQLLGATTDVSAEAAAAAWVAAFQRAVAEAGEVCKAHGKEGENPMCINQNS